MSVGKKCKNCSRTLISCYDDNIKNWDNFCCVIKTSDNCLECLIEYYYDLKNICKFCGGIEMDLNLLKINIGKIQFLTKQEIITQPYICECFI